MSKLVWVSSLVCAMALLAGCAMNRVTTLPKEPVTTGFVAKSLAMEGQEYLYSVFVPADYDPAKAWPMVLFLHGLGERGSDGVSQTRGGIGKAIRQWPERFPCIVVMPQCPDTSWWKRETKFLDRCVAQTTKEYHIHRDRMYLTGLSMGGFGSWQYGALRTDTFAAILPICGGGKGEDARKLARVPIWAFHGAEDPLVSPKRSRQMVEAVRAAGGTVRYTEYPGVQHNSWDKTYGDPEVIAWMLVQSK